MINSVKKNKSIILTLSATLYFFLFNTPLIVAEPGIYPDKIVIGQSCPTKGPLRHHGNNIKEGATAYFSHINATGGIDSREIVMITYNDSYNPSVCEKNTLKLINNDKVFLLFGYVGTPTSKAVLPIIQKATVPFFAPFTGADFLRSPLIKEVFNIRASYIQETDAIVERLVTEKKLSKISVFYQSDEYGSAGFMAVHRALGKRSLAMHSSASYERNTTKVGNAVHLLKNSKPEAIIMIGTYAPCAEFIKQMRKGGGNPVFVSVSAVGSKSLASLLSDKGIGLGVAFSQVVPFPFDTRIPIVKEYQKHLAKYVPKAKANSTSLEGYISAKALCTILSKMKGDPTRKSFIDTCEQQSDVDIGGFRFSFSPENHQGSDSVFFTQIGPGGYLTMLKQFYDLCQYKL